MNMYYFFVCLFVFVEYIRENAMPISSGKCRLLLVGIGVRLSLPLDCGNMSLKKYFVRPIITT